MDTTGITAIPPPFTPATSVITEGRVNMNHTRVWAQFCAGLFLSVAPVAQVRETGRVPVQAVQPQAGQAANPSTTPESSLTRDSFSTGVSGTRVALGPGDLLEITVFDTPELTQKARVSSKGKITMPLLGEIDVLDLSPGEVEGMIRSRLIEGQFI